MRLQGRCWGVDQTHTPTLHHNPHTQHIQTVLRRLYTRAHYKHSSERFYVSLTLSSRKYSSVSGNKRTCRFFHVFTCPPSLRRYVPLLGRHDQPTKGEANKRAQRTQPRSLGSIDDVEAVCVHMVERFELRATYAYMLEIWTTSACLRSCEREVGGVRARLFGTGATAAHCIST